MSRKLLLVLAVLALVSTAAMAAGKAETAAPAGATLRILTANVEADDKDYNTYAKNPADFPVLQQMEKDTGIHLVIEAVNSSNYGSVLLPRIAAKTNLPDLFVQGGSFDIVKYANDGVIIALDDQITKNAPNMVALMKQVPDIKHDLNAPDGHLYAFPGRVSPYDNRFNILGLGYRADWAKKLNIADPRTMDDWYAMLTAFKTKDPNGSGKNDEIAYGAGYSNTLNTFAGAFGLSGFNDWWSVAADKKTVLYDWYSSQDKAKAFLTTMNKWYKEGLISQEFPNDHGDKIDAMSVTNQVGARTAWSLYFPSTSAQMQKDYPGAQWVVAYPPKGPFGDVGSEQYGPVNSERWMVTTAAKDPSIAVKWMDFVFASQKGMDLMNWGVEGLSYYVDSTGAKQYTNNATNSHYGAGNISGFLASIGASRWPHVFTLDAYGKQVPDATPDYLVRLTDMDKQGMFKRSFYFGSLTATKDESAALATKLNDIKTYQAEMFYKFILGTEPLSNYPAFVAQLKKLGIEDVIAIKQAQYNRFSK